MPCTKLSTRPSGRQNSFCLLFSGGLFFSSSIRKTNQSSNQSFGCHLQLHSFAGCKIAHNLEFYERNCTGMYNSDPQGFVKRGLCGIDCLRKVPCCDGDTLDEQEIFMDKKLHYNLHHQDHLNNLLNLFY